MVIPKQKFPRDKHATISVLTYKRDYKFTDIDDYLRDCEQRFDVEYIKPMTSTEKAWNDVMTSINAELNNRGKNIVLECLQFGGNLEFWDSFRYEHDIRKYFEACYNYAIWKIGFLHTHENIICAVIITEPNRRNLFVYYLPITEQWQAKVMSNNKSELGNKLQKRD